LQLCFGGSADQREAIPRNFGGSADQREAIPRNFGGSADQREAIPEDPMGFEPSLQCRLAHERTACLPEGSE
jgi:hypothetical protein